MNIDFEREEGYSQPWILEHVYCSKQQMTATLERAGFKLERELDILKLGFDPRVVKHFPGTQFPTDRSGDNYFTFFRKV